MLAMQTVIKGQRRDRRISSTKPSTGKIITSGLVRVQTRRIQKLIVDLMISPVIAGSGLGKNIGITGSREAALPEPEGPINETKSPSRMLKQRLFNTLTGFNKFSVYSFVNLSVEIKLGITIDR